MIRPLAFTNTGSRSCELRGFPGVSYVAGDDGHQVGPAAQETGERAGQVVLQPGGTAALFVPADGTGCAGTPPGPQLTVRSVTAP